MGTDKNRLMIRMAMEVTVTTVIWETQRTAKSQPRNSQPMAATTLTMNQPVVTAKPKNTHELSSACKGPDKSSRKYQGLVMSNTRLYRTRMPPEPPLLTVPNKNTTMP